MQYALPFAADHRVARNGGRVSNLSEPHLSDRVRSKPVQLNWVRHFTSGQFVVWQTEIGALNLEQLAR